MRSNYVKIALIILAFAALHELGLVYGSAIAIGVFLLWLLAVWMSRARED